MSKTDVERVKLSLNLDIASDSIATELKLNLAGG